MLARQPGFSLHAATCCEAKQRDKLEKLCRYITRPAIANERLSTNERGQVIYRFKQPFRDGTTHVVLDPLDFIARLAALVPRPRLNLTRFHGLFAPNCKLREHIVPRHQPTAKAPDKPLAPMTWMQRLKRVFSIDIETCPIWCLGRDSKMFFNYMIYKCLILKRSLPYPRACPRRKRSIRYHWRGHRPHRPATRIATTCLQVHRLAAGT